MAITNLYNDLVLDVYNHDQTQSTIKAIALDDNSRFVRAQLTSDEAPYTAPQNAAVTLTVIRPDKVGVAVTGSTYAYDINTGGEYDPETGDEITPSVDETYYGVTAELDQIALAKSGVCLAQFKIVDGTQTLRTEIFKINNGVALDATTDQWAGSIDGYNLDELVERVDSIELSQEELEWEISALNTQLNLLEDNAIDQPYSGTLGFSIGGINVSNGKTNNTLTARLRLVYTRVSPSSAYRFEIDGTDYVAMFVHFYSSNQEIAWLGNPFEVQSKRGIFTTPEGTNYIRIVFKDGTNDSRTMEASDVTALADAFRLFQTALKKERTGEFIRFTVKDNHRWTDNASTTTDDAESSEEVDHLCILTLPESYAPTGKKTPLIMYCHGASCGITDNSWYGNSTGEGDGANFLAMIRRFTSEGYAIFDVDNTRHVTSGFNDWGSLPLMSAYIKAWEYVKENYNVESDLYLLSASMGTPVAQNMMKWYKGNIKAALILAPRPFGIKGRWDETYGTITDARKKEFLVAWGLEDDAILTDDTFVVPAKSDVFTAAVDARFRGFYHYENMVTIDNTNYVFEKYPPMKVMVGLSDTSFLPEVRAFYAALQNFGNYVNYREVTGKTHGAMCTLVGGGLLDEGVAWFERFRYVDNEVTG